MNLKQQFAARLMDSPLWHRWQRLAPRERLLLTLLGAFLLAVIFYLLLWLPAMRGVTDARQYYEEQRSLYAYLQENTELARSMSRDNQPMLPPEQLQGLVTQTAQDRGLRIDSFDMNADGNLQVSLPGVSYSAMLFWVEELQALGVSLAEVSLQRAGEGRVDARLTFRVAS